jgi:hypothetical protein
MKLDTQGAENTRDFCTSGFEERRRRGSRSVAIKKDRTVCSPVVVSTEYEDWNAQLWRRSNLYAVPTRFASFCLMSSESWECGACLAWW